MKVFYSAFLAFFLLAAAPLHAAELTAYKNTNALVMDKQFRASLKHFFGGAKGSYLWAADLVSAQALEALGGPPDDLQPLDNGLTLASACRAHSCPEKGAVLLQGNGVVAAALINFKCHGEPMECAEDPTLTIFLRDKGLAPATATPIFEQWANAKNAEAAALMGSEAERLPTLKAEVVQLKAE